MVKKSIICLINGPWQAVCCLAALETRNFLNSQYEIIPVIVEMFENTGFYEITKEILFNVNMKRTGLITKNIPAREMSNKINELENLFNTSFSDSEHLFIFGDHRPVAKYLCNYCKEAEITVFEDGIRTYIDGYFKESSYDLRILSWLKIVLGCPHYYLSKSYRKRIKSVALLLSDWLKTDFGDKYFVYKMSEKVLKEIIGRVVKINVKKDLKGKFVLIIGQYYHKLNQISYRDELNIYIKAAEKISALGCVPVWRGHIREEDSMFLEIKNRCNEIINFNELIQNSNYPIEFYGEYLVEKCSGIVSIASSSLFYFKYFYKIKSFSLCNNELISKMKLQHKKGLLLTMKHINSFIEFNGGQ